MLKNTHIPHQELSAKTPFSNSANIPQQTIASKRWLPTQHNRPRFSFMEQMAQPCCTSSALKRVSHGPHRHYSNMMDEDQHRVMPLTKVIALLAPLRPEPIKHAHRAYFDIGEPNIDYTASILDWFDAAVIGDEAITVLEKLNVLDATTKIRLVNLAQSINQTKYDPRAPEHHTKVAVIDQLLEKLRELKHVVCSAVENSACPKKGAEREAFNAFYDQTKLNEGKLNQLMNALCRGRRMNAYSASRQVQRTLSVFTAFIHVSSQPANVKPCGLLETPVYYAPPLFSSVLNEALSERHIQHSPLSEPKKQTLLALSHTMELERCREDAKEAPLCLLPSEREAAIELAEHQLNLLTKGPTQDTSFSFQKVLWMTECPMLVGCC